MNLPEIERLVELVQNANISELTLRYEGSRVTIRKTPAGPTVQCGELMPYSPGGVASATDDDGIEQANLILSPPTAPEAVSIYSPLVGHFRHIKPMVGLGARVVAGQVVGVIEAVKLINEITSPAIGIVTDVLVDDGQAVEYGQELFTVQPDG